MLVQLLLEKLVQRHFPGFLHHQAKGAAPISLYNLGTNAALRSDFAEIAFTFKLLPHVARLADHTLINQLDGKDSGIQCNKPAIGSVGLDKLETVFVK
jgi:hypothetical protein